MNRKLIALIIIVIVLGAGAATIYFVFFRKESEIELSENRSSFEGLAIIHEIKPSEDVSSEFIELLLDIDPADVEGWTITTYDDDRIILPELTGNGKNIYLRVYSGTGSNELDCSDNQATIYGNFSSHILALARDEVGLHDSEGKLIDFMRYGNGNGDPVMGAWVGDDPGPNAPSNDNSLSLIGTFEDRNSGANWRESPITPGEPNIAVFETTGMYGGEELWITNGMRRTASGSGIEDYEINPDENGGNSEPDYLSQGENVTIIAAAGVNNTAIDYIQEHLNYSLNFYRQNNFTDPEKTDPNRIDVRVVQGNQNYTAGACYENGTIVIELGVQWTKEELKVVGEHELMHAFQFKKENDTHGDYHHLFFPDLWWAEGQAEFWGLMSMLRNYPNMTYETWMRMAQRIGSLNWFDHYRDLNATGAFREWGGTWNHYMASFLFMKFINETFGAQIFLEVFNRTRYYGGGSPHNVNPKDAFTQVLNMAWEEIYGRFLSWLLLEAHQANGVPIYTPNIRLRYNGTEIGDTTGVRGWGGAVIEEIEITNSTAFTIQLNNTWQVNNWTVRILIFYEDGTNGTIEVPMNSTTHSGQVHLNPSAPKKIAKIWVVKSLPGRWTGRISMKVVPTKTIRFEYENETIGDTIEVQPQEKIYEEIAINGTRAFLLNLNWTNNPNGTHWRFRINRYWSNGSITSEIIEIVNGTWPEDFFIDPPQLDNKLTKIVIVKENLYKDAANITMTVNPQVELTYNNNTVYDTTEVEANGQVYEVINIEELQPLTIFLNFSSGSSWNITVIRYFNNGTIDQVSVHVNKSAWGYYVNPNTDSVNITKIVVIKRNLQDVNANVTMFVGAIPNIPEWLGDPFLPGQEYPLELVRENFLSYGGIITGCLDLETEEYFYYLELSWPGAVFNVLLFNSNFELYQEYNNIIDFFGYEIGPSFPTDRYYIIIQVHEEGENTAIFSLTATSI